jgi:hypothetical protein
VARAKGRERLDVVREPIGGHRRDDVLDVGVTARRLCSGEARRQDKERGEHTSG